MKDKLSHMILVLRSIVQSLYYYMYLKCHGIEHILNSDQASDLDFSLMKKSC